MVQPSGRRPPRTPTLDELRRYAVARSLGAPTTLGRAIDRLGFVQADPIRAPARAQDLTLRHRVTGYRAGDLERRYPKLAIEEDCLVNYGFLPRAHVALLHPRTAKHAWDPTTEARAADMLAFIRERGPTHPREALAAFDHGRVPGYWGGTLNATTHLLDGMHYRGLLRVARRDQGTRVYATAAHAPCELTTEARAAALLRLIVAKYAPLPSVSLGYLAHLLEYGAPGSRAPIQAALQAARRTLPSATVEGVTWLWPEGDHPASKRHAVDDEVRLLAPFDPIVWDRRRFALLWGWTYKFEAYTPAPQRRFGHYALPVLWQDRVVGWANVQAVAGHVKAELGSLDGLPRDRLFKQGLAADLLRLQAFLTTPGLD